MVDWNPPTAESDDEWHPLLRRQLRRAYGEEIPEACVPLLAAVNDAYHQADFERTLLERSLDLTSEELMERNDSLRAELRERERMAQEIQATRVFYENLVSELPVEVALFDDQGRFVYLNPASIADPELRAWLIGKTNLDYARFRGRALGPYEQRHARLLEVAETGEDSSLEESFTTPDGQVVHMLRVHARVSAPGGRAHHVIGYGVNLTEQKQAEEALGRAKEQAEAAQLRAEEMLRLKSALLNNMSHEIRTPLTGILGFSEVLAEEVAEEQQEFARVIHSNARRLLDTLNSVLDLAQLESGSMTLSAQRVDAVAEARNMVTLLGSLAEEKGIALLSRTPAPAFVLGDATALHRVLTNLVGNAIKFTERGEVEVSVEPTGESVVLTIRDTGRGISEAFLPHLFDEFKQESTGLARFHEGNGLGLAITRRLVEMMGGEIGVESELGRGTTFEVRLPAWQAVEA